MPSKPAFDFLERPPRAGKPRSRGLTVASDRARSLAQARDFIETAGDVIDHMKIPDHVGVMWRCSAAQLRKKNALYAKAGIDTLPGGIPFEVAAVQGRVPRFMERVAELGFGGVEVSEDSIDISRKDRVHAIRHALANDLTVFTELGKKFPENPLNAEEAIEMAGRDLDAGAHLVVVEKSDVALVIRQGTDTLHRLMRGVGPEHLIIECGPGADRFDIAKWLIREFGPDVNLENIDAEDAYVIEAMRYGLNRAADYSYFHPWRGRKLPAIPAP
ncbi:MAG: phosphosulfolactate synthase [Betaproteobacteria bacterium]|nr:phosphosulfolactate synthase [Betaproteobacteria bacterium]